MWAIAGLALPASPNMPSMPTRLAVEAQNSLRFPSLCQLRSVRTQGTETTKTCKIDLDNSMS